MNIYPSDFTPEDLVRTDVQVDPSTVKPCLDIPCPPGSVTDEIPEPDDGALILTGEMVYQRDDAAGGTEDPAHWFQVPDGQVFTWTEIVTYARHHGQSILVLGPVRRLL